MFTEQLVRIPTLISAALLAACASPEAASPLAADQAAPPLVLDGGPFVPGVTQLIRVTGANPGDDVLIVGTTSLRTNATTCLTVPAVCVDLPGVPSIIQLLGTATADADGMALVPVVVPATPKMRPHGIQAVGDPNGAPYLSNTVDAEFVDGADDEDGDGLSNVDEALLGTSVANPDTDGGGSEDGDEVAVGTDPLDPTDDGDLDGDGYTVDDCDETDPEVNPGALELCDGIDNNCDNITDGTDAWFDTDYAYRVPIVVTGAPGFATLSPPVAVDVDFAAALATAADASGLDPDSVRVVRQDCFAGNPEMPSEFMDDVAGVFERAAMDDPPGDDFGAVVFLADSDGDYTRRDIVNAGATASFGIYFNSNATSTGTAASYASSLVVDSDGASSGLSNALTESTYDGFNGGMADWVSTVGRPNTGNQTSIPFGQGVFLGQGSTGSWVTANDGTDVQLDIVHEGPIFGAVRSSGSAASGFGGFDYSYTYFMFEGRPEIYAKVLIEFNQPSTIRQSPFWGSGVRAWFASNASLSGASAQGAGGVPDFNWVRGTYDIGNDPYGIAVVYRQSVALRSRPIFDATGTANAGRYVAVAGQDITDVFVNQVEYDATAGERPLDHSIIAIYPHEGVFGSVSSDFFGIGEGVSTTIGTVEAQ